MMNLSIRSISRSIPRLLRSSNLRPLSTGSRPTFHQSSFKPAIRATYAAFSTSTSRREPAGESDQELSAKIEQELSLEKQSRDPAQVPASVQDYINDGPFEIEDQAGTEEVVLTRKFGDETIKVTFSVADLDDFEDQEMDQDNALEDEDGIMDDDMPSSRPKRTINQSGSKGGAVDVMPEDSIAPSDRSGEDDDSAASEDQMSSPFPTQLNVTITKPNKGAVQIIGQARDGLVEIVDVFYFPRADVADPKTAEKQHARQSIYAGPPFGNLDPDLQAMLERYIDERGINAQLAQFVPDYIDYKEQREYVQWLQNMKDFVDA